MKALAFKQPWAHAVLHLGKRIDNRQRKDGRMPAVCKHRGPLLIHASAGETYDYYNEAARWMRDRIGAELPWSKMSTVGWMWRRGGIVGRCVVIGHVTPDGRIWLGEGEQDDEVFAAVDRRWHMAGSYGLVLAEVEPVPFVPFRGGLGLFEVPE